MKSSPSGEGGRKRIAAESKSNGLTATPFGQPAIRGTSDYSRVKRILSRFNLDAETVVV
jgi:hypothetical protein